MRDKKVDQVLASLAPSASRFVFTSPDTPRAATPEELVTAAARAAASVPADAVRDPLEGVRLASAHGSPVVVAGSLYLAGEIRAGLS
jgi:dihydrofolate synthase/folylpolyglutamate synthase